MIARQRIPGVAVLAATTLLAACRDGLLHPPAPAAPAAVALAASVQSLRGGIAEAYQRVDRMSIRFLAGTEVRLEQIVPFDPAATETRISLQVPLNDLSETLTIELELRAGNAALFRGSGEAVLSAGGTSEASIPIRPIVAGVTCGGPPLQVRAYGAAVPLTGFALFASGDTIPDVPITWTAPAGGVLTVLPGGQIVAGLQDGTAQVRCSASGFNDTREVQVFAIVAQVQVTPARATAEVGGTITFSAALRDSLGHAITAARPVTWTSANTAIATVTGGVATGRAPGTVAIRAASGSAADSALLTVLFAVPVVTTVPASGVSGSGATLNGTVNPRGAATRAWFEWSTAADLARATATAAQLLDPGNVVQAVSHALSGLLANQTYYFRVVAESQGGTARGTILSFNTQAAPAVRTISGTPAGAGATLVGGVNPQGLATQAWFEWSTSPSLAGAQRTPAQALGAGRTETQFSAALAELSALTTYYFRAAASSTAGTGYGLIQSFRTGTLQPPSVAGLGSSWVYSMPDTAWRVEFSGEVTPNGGETEAWFEVYGDPTLRQFVGSTSAVNVGSGTEPTEYAGTILLQGCGPYYYRAVAANPYGTAYGDARETYCEGGGGPLAGMRRLMRDGALQLWRK